MLPVEAVICKRVEVDYEKLWQQISTRTIFYFFEELFSLKKVASVSSLYSFLSVSLTIEAQSSQCQQSQSVQRTKVSD